MRARCGAVGSPAVPVDEALQVPHERPGMRQQVMAQQHGLGVLEVGASGHGRVRVSFGLADQGIHGLHQSGGAQPCVVTQEHSSQGGDLVVA